MHADDFDYQLPASAIAQTPAPQRDGSRLLVVGSVEGEVSHRATRDLPDLLDPGDLLVLNTTRVIPARLRLRRPTGGAVEVLLVAPLDDERVRWSGMVRPSRKVRSGSVLEVVGSADDRAEASGGRPAVGLPTVTVGEVIEGGLRVIDLSATGRTTDEFLEAYGELPLPPYIDGPIPDPDRYQTVYAERATSVAAPTAGLHLTDKVLERCRERGIEVAGVELDIGPGTFVPITTENIKDHDMHAETYRVPEGTIAAVEATRQRGGAIVAVGTTVVRTLESWAATGQRSGATRLYITPGYPFAVVDRLMTNFHQPRSTLLVLLESFMGPSWRTAYADALDAGYRFLSLGDAMLVDRAPPSGSRPGEGP